MKKIIVSFLVFLQLAGCATTQNGVSTVDPVKTSAVVLAIAGAAFLLLRGFENELGKGVASNFGP